MKNSNDKNKTRKRAERLDEFIEVEIIGQLAPHSKHLIPVLNIKLDNPDEKEKSTDKKS